MNAAGVARFNLRLIHLPAAALRASENDQPNDSVSIRNHFSRNGITPIIPLFFRGEVLFIGWTCDRVTFIRLGTSVLTVWEGTAMGISPGPRAEGPYVIFHSFRSMVSGTSHDVMTESATTHFQLLGHRG